jgi:hypothetical protein
MPSKNSSMQTKNRNREFAMTVVLQMREENWVVRHEWFKRLLRMYPIMCEYVLDMMGPDELLNGSATGKHVVPGSITLCDINTKKRQTTLIEYGFIKKRRQ